MSFLRYRNPDFIDAQQTLVDPREINENFDDIARVVNGSLGAENLMPGVKIAASAFECDRSAVSMHFDFARDPGAAYAPTTKPLFKTPIRLALVSVAVIQAVTTGATEWHIKNGDTVMADLLTGHSGTQINYLVDEIANDALDADETVSIVFTGTGTIQALTLFFTAAHQS